MSTDYSTTEYGGYETIEDGGYLAGYAAGYAEGSALEIGRILASDLTFGTISDPNSVLASGTILAGTVNSGAAQAGPSAGAWAFAAISRDALGETWSNARALDVLSQTLLPEGEDFNSEGVAWGFGLVWGNGAAPTQYSEIVAASIVLIRGVSSGDTDPGYLGPDLATTYDKTGQAGNVKRQIRMSCTLTYSASDAVSTSIARVTVSSMLSDGTWQNGSQAIPFPATEATATGRVAALAAVAYRAQTVTTNTAYSMDGSVFPVMAPEPPL